LSKVIQYTENLVPNRQEVVKGWALAEDVYIRRDGAECLVSRGAALLGRKLASCLVAC
jgi:hypothetical protein